MDRGGTATPSGNQQIVGQPTNVNPPPLSDNRNKQFEDKTGNPIMYTSTTQQTQLLLQSQQQQAQQQQQSRRPPIPSAAMVQMQQLTAHQAQPQQQLQAQQLQPQHQQLLQQQQQLMLQQQQQHQQLIQLQMQQHQQQPQKFMQQQFQQPLQQAQQHPGQMQASMQQRVLQRGQPQQFLNPNQVNQIPNSPSSITPNMNAVPSHQQNSAVPQSHFPAQGQLHAMSLQQPPQNSQQQIPLQLQAQPQPQAHMPPVQLPTSVNLPLQNSFTPPPQHQQQALPQSKLMNPYAAPGSVVPESELALQPLRSFTKPKWYKPLSADECEKRAFPDLFLAPQNSLSRYVKIRELILTWYKYTQQITYTNCRRSLVSKGITEDACLILRIYNFLVHHHFFEIASASPSSANNDSSLRDAVTTAARVPSSDSSNMNTGSNLDLHNTMPIKPKLSQRLCEKCGADCSKLTKNGSMLCDDCVALGADGTDLKNSLPENLMADATTSNTPHSEPPWTEEETFRLLEGLEIYNMDWDKIAKYVQTRTKHQCVEHLIQMPIEDPYLEDNISVNTNKGTVPGTFASSPNPVMTLVSFLAATVSPAVAAAAATAARNAILAENSRTDTELPSTPSDSLDSISHEECQTASAAALACAAEKASELVKSEDRKIQSCVMEVIEEQMHRLELKLNHFLELESNLESEWMKLQQLQKQLQQQIIYQQQITHQRIDMSRQAPQLHQMQSPANYQSFPQGIPSQPVNHPHQPTPTLHQQVMPTQATQFPTTLGQPMFQQLAIQQAQQQILSPQALPTLQPGQQIPQQRLDI